MVAPAPDPDAAVMASSVMPTVTVVIPVYRAEQTLPDLYRQLSDSMLALSSAFEIIFVEDGGGGNFCSRDIRNTRRPRC
jgi:hypothetical protein